MAGCGCGDGGCRRGDDAYWKALLWALLVNFVFFGIETVGAFRSGSSSLLADAVDFLGDAVNYGSSLLVTGMAAIWSTRLAKFKGTIMFSWGLLVFGRAAWMAMQGRVPEASTMTLLSILIAIYVHQTGILLTLGFDLLLACLAFPFILGLYWRRGTTAAALTALIVGGTVRLTLFVLMPTMYGLPNDIWYIPNPWFTPAMDGWVTFIAAAVALATYVTVSLLTPPSPIRGLDIRVADDLDEALPEEKVRALVAEEAGAHETSPV